MQEPTRRELIPHRTYLLDLGKPQRMKQRLSRLTDIAIAHAVASIEDARLAVSDEVIADFEDARNG